MQMTDALALLRAERRRLKDEQSNLLKNTSPSLNQTIQNQERASQVETSSHVECPRTLLLPRALGKPIKLEKFDERLLSCVKVYPNFVTADEEAYLLRQIYNPEKANWQNVRNRRLQCFGGDPVPDAPRTELPDWLKILGTAIESSQVIEYKINHVLLNEYREGEGILPHTDGPSYHPCVACLSIGDACATMKFQTKLRSEDIGKRTVEDLLLVTLQPRCLVVFTGFAYTDVLHSIEDVRDGSKRISLTMRKILI